MEHTLKVEPIEEALLRGNTLVVYYFLGGLARGADTRLPDGPILEFVWGWVRVTPNEVWRYRDGKQVYVDGDGGEGGLRGRRPGAVTSCVW